ncbi:MAG TPA: hypothetical protein VHW96_08445 [Solirubrobacteraceae bacterium]|nr:hypothetical protein [Solirubrobacteraceae bacterium]
MHDDDLLAQCAAGDAEAFVAFYQRHLPAVLGFFCAAPAIRS